MRAERGFSLIELLTVMAILGFMLAAGAPALSEFTRNSAVSADAAELRDGLTAARMEALRCNQSVAITIKGPTWSFTDCQGNTRAANARTTERTAVKFAAEATPLSATSTKSITFTSSGRATGNTGNYAFTATGAALSLTVSVGSGGLIRTCNPSKTTGADAC